MEKLIHFSWTKNTAVLDEKDTYAGHQTW